MKLLVVLLTHLPPAGVETSLDHLRATLPGARFGVVHGGKREDFDALALEEKVFTTDPGLRGPAATGQSYNEVFALVLDHLVQPVGDEVDRVLFLEFDHVPLRVGLGERLTAVMDATGADLLGKTCTDRTGTNWWHRVRYRDDAAFAAFLRRVSVREDPTRMWGMLGTGFVLTRRALEAFCAVDHHEGVYNELYVPTLLHHLGFRCVDVDAHDPSLYAHVRWSPPYGVEEAVALRDAGAVVVHPFKAHDALGVLRAGEGTGGAAERGDETARAGEPA